MIESPIRIMSVNMRRHNNMTHVLLQNSTADILLIQEPWYNTVSITRSDSDPEGVPVRGPIINNLWSVFLPAHSPSDTCKVAIYVKTHLAHVTDWSLLISLITMWTAFAKRDLLL